MTSTTHHCREAAAATELHEHNIRIINSKRNEEYSCEGRSGPTVAPRVSGVQGVAVLHGVRWSTLQYAELVLNRAVTTKVAASSRAGRGIDAAPSSHDSVLTAGESSIFDAHDTIYSIFDARY